MKICDFCGHKDGEQVPTNEALMQIGHTVQVRQLIINIQLSQFPDQGTKTDTLVYRKDCCTKCADPGVISGILQTLKLPTLPIDRKKYRL